MIYDGICLLFFMLVILQVILTIYSPAYGRNIQLQVAISRARSTRNRIHSLTREDKDTTNTAPQMCTTVLQVTIILTARWDSLALKGLCHELNYFQMANNIKLVLSVHALMVFTFFVAPLMKKSNTKLKLAPLILTNFPR